MSTIAVLSAAEAASLDRATIDAGVPSRALMQRAGAAAAGEIARRVRAELSMGVAVFAGAGNNGGDAWVVARALAAAGVSVRITEVEEPRTEDARAERALALRTLTAVPPTGGERLVVDGVLGTGTHGAPRGAAAGAIARINALGEAGAIVVALDVPSGLDATTGDAEQAVRADLTVTFGSLKRGHLIARATCGSIVVLDIGLVHHEADRSAPTLVDAPFVRSWLPDIPADAHKGTRKRLAIVGGSSGMLGATVLAARAAMRSGIGMVRVVVPPENLAPVQTTLPDALATTWPDTDADVASAVADWADAVLIGPGLGRSRAARALVERTVRGTEGPVVLDADALNVFAGDAESLGALLGDRPAVITPHPAEAGRLAGLSVVDVLARRWDLPRELSTRVRACVLLKGVPTVIGHGDHAALVSATGTAALAMAGSGDLLAGIAATLLVQSEDPRGAAACAAWIHGRAAELATERQAVSPSSGVESTTATTGHERSRHGVRGIALEDVLAELPRAWGTDPMLPTYPVLVELPAVTGRRSAV